MLKSLHIENYALIESISLDFGKGFTVITGETGAGKSILLGALSLLLGTRADLSVLHDPQKKCVVEGHFDIYGLGMENLFLQEELDYDGELILRRELLTSGKSRAFVNDSPVSLTTMRLIASKIIDIHSQHQTLTLGEGGFRISLLDSLAGDDTFEKYTTVYQRYTSLKRQLEALTTQQHEAMRDADYLQFQLSELQSADLEQDSIEDLEQQQQLLSHVETVKSRLAEAIYSLDNDTSTSIISAIKQTRQALSHISTYVQEVDGLAQRLNTAEIELDDILQTLQHLDNNITYDPQQQQYVEQRINTLNHLLHKHNLSTTNELIALRNDIEQRLNKIGNLDEEISRLMQEVDNAFLDLQKVAKSLTKSRTDVGKKLQQNILPVLKELGMPQARFEVFITPLKEPSPTGYDDIQFLFNANLGAELRPLEKIASGGEMSRLMLAIKSMLTSCLLLPTIIFDEIDTGISGDISVAAANILSRMSERMQVVAISHIPQVAARADCHYKVYKQTDTANNRTTSNIKVLDDEQRITEIATMLSSDNPTAAAIQTARELMKKA